MAKRMVWSVAALVLLLATLFAPGPNGEPDRASACVFLRNPLAYEADSGRSTYFTAMDAAAIDALFPNDPFFGLPPIEVGARAARTAGGRRLPSSLLRSIGWIESNLTMASRSVPFDSTGPALVSFDCGHGVMQVTTGMTVPLGTNNQPTPSQVNVATHYLYNIARGASILADKWNQAPELRPIAGTDSGSDPNLIENWYFAVWSYNGFTGPGALRSNHPLDPIYSNPRPAFRCDSGQSRTRYPYQELVWGCMSAPPLQNGQPLWAPVPASLPNLGLPQFFQPLSLANFIFPYAGMDMPTPQPAHAAPLPVVAPDWRARTLGAPVPSVTRQSVELRVDGGPDAARATIEVQNVGTGILSWHATPGQNWIVLDPPAGVALGRDIACAGVCARGGTFTITVNPTLLQQASGSGTVRISAANANAPPVDITVNVAAKFEVGAPGTSRAY